MEIFVGDDGFDTSIVGIRGGLRRSQHVFIVEDVEALVLHRAHVEVGDGHDHENIEIVLAAESLLVPTHGTLERIHGIGAAVFLAVLDIDAQRHVAARHRAELVFHARKIAADQREQIRRLRMRVVPDREMAAIGQVAAVDEIAIRQQHRRLSFVGLDAGGVDRHHVGAVGEIGDAAEAFRLALGAPRAARSIKPGELGVGGGVDRRHDLQRERSVGWLWNGELVGRHQKAVGTGIGAIDPERLEREPFAIEHQRRGRIGGIGLELQRRAHPGLGRMQREIEGDGLHQPVWRAVVLEADGLGGVGAHDDPM